MGKLSTLKQITRNHLLPPKEIHKINFWITHRCNHQCSICNIWQIYQEQPSRRDDELTLKEIQTLFESNTSLHSLKTLAITGGEPFLRPDIVDIITSLHKMLPHTWFSITTNGFATSLIIKRIQEILRRCNGIQLGLSISLDGDEETHDATRGVPGSYKRAMETINQAKAHGIESLSAGFTISPSNWNKIIDVIEASRKNDVECSYHLAHKAGFYKNQSQDLCLPDHAHKKLIEWIDKDVHHRIRNIQFKQLLFETKSFFLFMVPRYDLQARRNYTCYAGTHSLNIDPYGNVYPCIMRSDLMGNIRTTDFEDIRRSEASECIRRSIARKECNCWTECETILNLNYHWRVPYFNLGKYLSRHF